MRIALEHIYNVYYMYIIHAYTEQQKREARDIP